MQTLERRKIFHDEWPTEYPKGKRAFLDALDKASKWGLFETREDDGGIIITHLENNNRCITITNGENDKR